MDPEKMCLADCRPGRLAGISRSAPARFRRRLTPNDLDPWRSHAPICDLCSTIASGRDPSETNMPDKIYTGFLARQLEEAATLAGASDLVDILPVAPQAFAVDLSCKGLVRSGDGEIATADRFRVGIWFPSDYLRRANPIEVVTWLSPPDVFHPNIKAPLICIGRLVPGTPLADIVFRVFRIVAYQAVAMHDALNPEASAWARQNQHRFPVDDRPLKRRALDLGFEISNKVEEQ